jgi:hypothetical protein
VRLSALTLAAWSSLSADDRAEVCAHLAEQLDVPIQSIRLDGNKLTVAHPRSKSSFKLIFRHTASFGLSDAELRAAQAISTPIQANLDEMRPHRKLEVPAFLIAEEPLRNDSPLLSNEAFIGDLPESPAYGGYDQAEAACRRIGATPPSEIELEAAMRGGRGTLFCFGDELPSDAELDIWLSHDLGRSASRRNDFDLYGLFFPQWTRDEFCESHAADARVQNNGKVIKGGGAYFWPWQDEEWVWCMSAMRMPSADLIDGEAVIRPVILLR